MQCPRCQHENPPGMKFCGVCAAPLAATCPSCGAPNPPENKFCGQCAAPLRTTPTAKFAGPESYTPKHLAEKILTSKAALEGERKQVTVLFADLKGSMELLADRDPEEARKLLDPVLERMMEAVHRYEGTVNQVMGDGIMALFGAPLAHEDHAVRACYAALRMQETVKKYAEEVRRSHAAVVKIRVGLNSGEVVVRSIGSDLHMDYTAVGQTTHLAARMEQLADPGAIVLTPETLALAEGYVEVKSLGPVPIKGLAELVEVFELAGASAARTRLEAAARRGLTRFVGRTAELEQLRSALDRASLGHGQVVAVVGEPGVGKSRLFWEVSHSHRVHGWLIVQSASVSYGKATAYLPVIELLRGYFAIDSRDDPRKIREKVTGKVLTLAPALGPVVPAFLALLDVPVDEASWHALDPAQRRQQTLDAIKRLLLRESDIQPLVVVFEDLHWIDGETQTLLESLIESLPAARLLLLVNYRPEYRHTWGGKTYYRQLRIDPLPPESAEELLDALLGLDAALGPLKRLLVERTEANPLFLEESVRALVETAALAGERGAYGLTRPVETLRIPSTVQAILAARIDRLAPEAKRLLQAAAVIGKDVPMPLLLAIADAPEHEVRAELTHLQAAEFLYETRLFPDLEYTFKHALTHEVAYGSLLHERRRTIHARIVEAIEQLYPDRPGEHVERLAHHAVRGEEWEKAFVYLRRAGAKAAERLALWEAAAWLEQAVAVADRLPRRRDVLEQSIDLRLEFRTVLFPLGEFERVRDHQSKAGVLAEEIGDRLRLGRATAFQAHYHCIIAGEMPEALERARRAMVIAEAAAAPGLVGVARFFLGQVLHGRGDYAEAIATLQANIQSFQGEHANDRGGLAAPISVLSRVWLAFALAEIGRFAEGISVAEQAIEQAETLAHPYSLYHAYWARAVVHLGSGEHERAVEAVSRIRQVSGMNVAFAHNAAGLLGHAQALAGRSIEALQLLEDVNAREHRTAFIQYRDVLSLGEAYMLGDRLDDALSAARQALTLAQTSSARGLKAHALQLLGDVHAARGHDDQAESFYCDAMALGAELGMRPLLARCHFGLGKLYRRTGKRQEAQEHLTTATTMYREMDMRFWLEQAEAELKETR